MSPEDRALATELCYGVLRRRERLDRALDAFAKNGTANLEPTVRIALRMAAYQILFLDRIPAYAAVNDAVEVCKSIGGRGVAGFANALLRRLARTGEPPLPDAAADPAGYLEAAIGFPDWLVRLLLAELPAADALAFGEASVVPAPVTLRASVGRVARDELLARLAAERPGAALAPSQIAPDAILARRFEAPATTAAWREGLFVVQDAGAQVVAELCGAAPGERILDACAGGGGKTAHLLALSGGKAEVDAVDNAPAKLDEARRTLQRLGLSGARLVVADSDAAARQPRAVADLRSDLARRPLQRARRAAPPSGGADSPLARRFDGARGAAAGDAHQRRAGAPSGGPHHLRRLHVRAAGVRGGRRGLSPQPPAVSARARRSGRRSRPLGSALGPVGGRANLAAARRRRRILRREASRGRGVS